MDESRINYINKETIKFPIFFYLDEDMTDIVQALYVEQINGSTVNNMPFELVVVKENENGIRTTASYVLKESTKYASSTINPIEN